MGVGNSTNGTDIDWDAILSALFAQIAVDYAQSWFGPAYNYLRLIISVVLMILFSIFGIVTNIINVIVFYRQGILTDSCTPCLVGLALSDLGVNLLALGEAILYLPTYKGGEFLVGSQFGVIAQVVGLPYAMFTLLTCLITTFLAFERMISVTFPFKVKELFTPKRSVIVNVFLFCLLFVLNYPNLFRYRLAYNAALGGLAPYDTGLVPESWGEIPDIINDLILRLLSVVLVIIFNAIMIVRVNMSSKFRETGRVYDKSVKGSNTDTTTTTTTTPPPTTAAVTIAKANGKISNRLNSKKNTKEMKLTRMLTVLCVMLVVCYFPYILMTLKSAFPSIAWDDANQALSIVSQFLQIINSSCNIVIYYTMSTRYRKELMKMCPCERLMPKMWKLTLSIRRATQ